MKNILESFAKKLRDISKDEEKKLKKRTIIYNIKLNISNKNEEETIKTLFKLIAQFFDLKDFNLNLKKMEDNIGINLPVNEELRKFLIGGWLEEYVFNIIHQLKEAGIDDVALNIQVVSPKEAKNEIDVIFTYENALYIVECKSLEGLHDPKQDILYKIGSLQRDFGLKVKSFLMTQAENIFDDHGDNIKDSLQARAKQMNTVIFPLIKIKDLKEEIQKNLHI